MVPGECWLALTRDAWAACLRAKRCAARSGLANHASRARASSAARKARMVLDVPPRVVLSPFRRCSSRSWSRAALWRLAAPLQAPVAKIVIARLTRNGAGNGARLRSAFRVRRGASRARNPCLLDSVAQEA